MQGHSFTEDLQCRFGNQSLAYVVNATVHSEQSASCWSPAWKADSNSMVNFSATTASNGCLDGVEFAYYLEPQVMHVAPITGPRYGSFDLRVQLDASVASFADAVSLVTSFSASSQDVFSDLPFTNTLQIDVANSWRL